MGVRYRALDFQTTADLEPGGEVLGQTTAQEALEFGIRCLSPGQNVFVRGQRGTGRSRMVRQLIKKLAPPTEGLTDYCYVFNFDRHDRPRLIRLAAGMAPKFRDQMLELGEYVNDGLGKTLDAEPWLSQRQAHSTARPGDDSRSDATAGRQASGITNGVGHSIPR